MPARKKPNPGWQQLQRERYGPEYRPPPRRSLHVAGDVVGQVMKDFGLEDSSRLADLQKAWPDLAGKTNAEQSRPGKLEAGTLSIYVDHHMWLNEMKRTLAPMLLKRIQERFGKKVVQRLRFEITPEEGE